MRAVARMGRQMKQATVRIHRCTKAEDVPPGITHAGVLMTPEGECYGLHLQVVETEGVKEFVGGVFRAEEPK